MQSSQQPFDGVHNPSGHDGFALNGPDRTSVLAVIALVFGLVCFIPGLGAIGAICGVAALFLISQSRGRLGGMGLAIAGILLGLLFTALQIGLIVGALQIQRKFRDEVLAPMGAMFVAIEAGDFASARQHFVAPHAAQITDADFEKFRTAYHEKVGVFKEPPRSVVEFFSAYASFGSAMQKLQGRQDSAPFPAIFANGPALVVYQMDSAAGRRPKQPINIAVNGQQTTVAVGDFPLKNVQILTQQGDSIILYDPGTTIGDAPAATKPLPADPAPKSPDSAPNPAPEPGSPTPPAPEPPKPGPAEPPASPESPKGGGW